jgi:periodic tryptophan protein 1
MVTATAWVPRGFAAPFPTKYEFDEAEFDRIAKLAKIQLDEAEEDLEEAKADAERDDDGMDDDDSGSDLSEDEGGAKVKTSKA